jgi:hypothetical protein
MFGFPSSELRARLCRSRDADAWIPPERAVGVCLRSDPFLEDGRVWQWVVYLDPGLPPLTDLLVNCHDFLVDDDCGREVGVVEGVDIDPNSAVPARLLVVQGWGRHHITVSVDDVIEVAPGERRLLVACRAGHRTPKVEPAVQRPGDLTDTGGTVRSLVARLTGRPN